MMFKPGTWTAWVFGIAAALRLVLTAYGEFHDARMFVKYTDIDYGVFTDAAREVTEGNSPFDRATYRYTPLLAWAMIPNVWWRPFGKLVFSIVDMAIGVMIYRILRMRSLSPDAAALHTAGFLLSPFTVVVSSRGNADSLVCALVVLVVYLLMKGRTAAAAIAYGFSVHVKIYPVIYGLPLILFLDQHYAGGAGAAAAAAAAGKATSSLSAAVTWVREFVSPRRIGFGLLSVGVFLALAAGLYQLYGWTFLWETYLYHFARTDNRHNFSPYFYDLYLRYDQPSRTGAGLLAFLPQFGTVLVLGALYYRDLPFCLFLQTLVFVTFNKVVTAQYFHWFMCLIPFMTAQSRLRAVPTGLVSSLLWVAAELHWNYWSYWLEIEGQSVFLWVWLAGLLFFAANIYVLARVISAHIYSPVFEDGKLLPIPTTTGADASAAAAAKATKAGASSAGSEPRSPPSSKRSRQRSKTPSGQARASGGTGTGTGIRSRPAALGASLLGLIGVLAGSASLPTASASAAASETAPTPAYTVLPSGAVRRDPVAFDALSYLQGVWDGFAVSATGHRHPFKYNCSTMELPRGKTDASSVGTTLVCTLHAMGKHAYSAQKAAVWRLTFIDRSAGRLSVQAPATAAAEAAGAEFSTETTAGAWRTVVACDFRFASVDPEHIAAVSTAGPSEAAGGRACVWTLSAASDKGGEKASMNIAVQHASEAAGASADAALLSEAGLSYAAYAVRRQREEERSFFQEHSHMVLLVGLLILQSGLKYWGYRKRKAAAAAAAKIDKARKEAAAAAGGNGGGASGGGGGAQRAAARFAAATAAEAAEPPDPYEMMGVDDKEE